MVMLDLDVKAIVGLAENERISKEDTKVHLEKFTKEDLIIHILSDVFDSVENDSVDIKETELTDEEY